MKKSIAVILAVVVLVLLVAPRFVGGSIESATIDTLLAIVPDEADDMLSINQTDFQRGWFSSYSEIEITLDGLEEITSAPLTIVLEIDIDHGPLLFTAGGPKMGFAYADIDPYLLGIDTSDLVTDSSTGTNKPLLTLFAGFDNSVQLEMEMDSFSARNREARFGFTGLQGSNRILPDLSGTATLQIDTLTFGNETGIFDFSIQNIAVSGAGSYSGRPVSPGQSSLSIERVNSTAPLPMTINNISADYQLLQVPGTSDYLSLAQQFSIGQLQWDFPVASLQWRFQLDHLNRELIENYVLLAQQAQQSNTANPSQAAGQLSTLGQELALSLTGESFSFENALDLTAFEGDHRVQLNIDWPGLPGITSIERLDIQELLRTVQITLVLDADHTALMNSPYSQTVIDYERPGFLTINNGRVTSTIRLADGMLDINGEVTPLEQFINL